MQKIMNKGARRVNRVMSINTFYLFFLIVKLHHRTYLWNYTIEHIWKVNDNKMTTMSTGTQTMTQRAWQDPNGEESTRRQEAEVSLSSIGPFFGFGFWFSRFAIVFFFFLAGQLPIFLNSDTKVVVFSSSAVLVTRQLGLDFNFDIYF